MKLAPSIRPRAIYETEDATPGGFYKFVPNQYGNLAAGGTLYALKVVGLGDYGFVSCQRRPLRKLDARSAQP